MVRRAGKLRAAVPRIISMCPRPCHKTRPQRSFYNEGDIYSPRFTVSALLFHHFWFIFSGAREYCQSETFKATCWTNEVVVMESAHYGRMHLGRCVEADLGYIGCSNSVLHLADKWCSGKRSCEIQVPNSDLDNTQPCFKELKTFLETDYKCVRGKSLEGNGGALGGPARW